MAIGLFVVKIQGLSDIILPSIIAATTAASRERNTFTEACRRAAAAAAGGTCTRARASTPQKSGARRSGQSCAPSSCVRSSSARPVSICTHFRGQEETHAEVHAVLVARRGVCVRQQRRRREWLRKARHARRFRARAAAEVVLDVVHDDERRVRARGGAQVREDLARVLVAPVVRDVPRDEDGRVRDGLRFEEVVRWGVSAGERGRGGGLTLELHRAALYVAGESLLPELRKDAQLDRETAASGGLPARPRRRR